MLDDLSDDELQELVDKGWIEHRINPETLEDEYGITNLGICMSDQALAASRDAHLGR